MKVVIFLAFVLNNISFSQNLVFYNNQDTIRFKENELININGQKYFYKNADKNNTQLNIININNGLAVSFKLNKIYTFQKYYKKYSIRYAFENAYSVFKAGFIGCGTLGFLLGSSWDGGTGSGPSIIESFAAGTLIGVVSGITGGLSLGGPSFIWHGFIALIEPYGEGKICNMSDYKLMFE